jgi:hypothetical protein
MSQATSNIVLDQGADQSRIFACSAADGSPSDLTGYTDVKCYAAKTAMSDNPVEIPATFLDGEGAVSAIGTTAGTIQISPTGDLTRPVAWTRGVWQIWLTAPTGQRFPLMGGQVTIRQQVPATTA